MNDTSLQDLIRDSQLIQIVFSSEKLEPQLVFIQDAEVEEQIFLSLKEVLLFQFSKDYDDGFPYVIYDVCISRNEEQVYTALKRYNFNFKSVDEKKAKIYIHFEGDTCFDIVCADASFHTQSDSLGV